MPCWFLVLALWVRLRDGEEVFGSVLAGVVPDSTGLVALFEDRDFGEGFFGEKISVIVSGVKLIMAGVLSISHTLQQLIQTGQHLLWLLFSLIA